MSRYDLCVVGAGILGETVIRQARGARKALIALPSDPESYSERLHAFLANATPSNSNETPLSADRYFGDVEFLSPTSLRVGEQTIEANKFVLVLGSVPRTPDIELSSHRLPLDPLPNHVRRVTVIGAGPVAFTLAQRWTLAGKEVTLVHRGALMAKEDVQAVEFLTQRLQNQGVKMEQTMAPADEFIFAGGMAANTSGLALEKTGVFVRPDGTIAVDDELRTSVKHIFAAGAVTGVHEFSTELAQARAAAANTTAPFFARVKVEPEPEQHVVFTDWPLARVGLTEAAAQERHAKTRLTIQLKETNGYLKLVANGKSGEIYGVHIVAPKAAELMLYFDLAMRAGISIFDLSEDPRFAAFTGGELIGRALEQWLAAAH